MAGIEKAVWHVECRLRVFKSRPPGKLPNTQTGDSLRHFASNAVMGCIAPASNVSTGASSSGASPSCSLRALLAINP